MNATATTIDLSDPCVSTPLVDSLIANLRTAQAMTRKADNDKDLPHVRYQLAAASEALAFWTAVEAVAGAYKSRAMEAHTQALKDAVEFA